MHGANGEDGTLQGLLELSDVAYTSSSVVSCAVCMDKIMMKNLLKGLNLPIVPWFFVTRDTFFEKIDAIDEKIKNSFSYPVVVKPANLGSSIGIAVCNNKTQLLEGLQVASEFDYKIIIEECISNLKEVNCSVLGFQDNITIASLEEPVSYTQFLSFQEKYLNTKTKNSGMQSLSRILPANITKKQENSIKQFSKTIFEALDCAGVVRIDFMIDKTKGEVFVNEVNTIPGSLAFYLWEFDQCYFSALIDKLIAFAYEKQAQKQKNKYTYTSSVLLHFGTGSKISKK
jgi:D-alanine-D-alanine ligase